MSFVKNQAAATAATQRAGSPRPRMHKKSELPVKAGFLDEETFSDDSFAQPEPEYAFDQRVTW